MFPSIKRLSKAEEIADILDSIHSQATRYERGTDEQEYLLRDLAFIAELADKLKKVIISDKDDYYH